MGSAAKTLETVLRGNADAGIRFDELCNLLLRMGFVLRTSGSHHLFRKTGIPEMINLQRDGNKAKPYQVRQVRQLILKHGLAGKTNG